MLCNECQENISDYIDDALELGERVKVERHLADCEPCRAVRDDLLQLVHFSRQLPLHTPATALWTRIQTEIEAERPKTIWARAASYVAGIQSRHFNLSIPQLAASAAALVILFSVVVVVARRDTAVSPTNMASNFDTPLKKNPLSHTDMDQIEQRIDQLSKNVEQRKVEWQPELRAAFDRNMFHVEQSLLECRQQLSGHPDDQMSQELMLNAYREKVRLLEGFERF
jgi:putative zinc finger protein